MYDCENDLIVCFVSCTVLGRTKTGMVTIVVKDLELRRNVDGSLLVRRVIGTARIGKTIGQR